MTKQDYQLRKVIDAHKAAEEARRRCGARRYDQAFKVVVRAAVRQGGESGKCTPCHWS